MRYKNKKNQLFTLVREILSIISLYKNSTIYKLIGVALIMGLVEIFSIAVVTPFVYLIQSSEQEIKIFTNNFWSLDISASNFYLFVAVIFSISSLFRIFLNTVINYSVENVRHNIGYKLFSGYIKQDTSYHKNSDNSELGKVILADVDQFIIFVLRPFVDGLTSLVIFVAITLYLMLYTSLNSLIQIGFVMTLYAVIYNYLKPMFIKSGDRISAANELRFKTSTQAFNLIDDIKSYKVENWFNKKFFNSSRNYSITQASYQSIQNSTKYILEAIVFCFIVYLSSRNNVSDSSSDNPLPIVATFAFAAYKVQPALMHVFNGINALRYGSKIIFNIKNHFIKQNLNKEKLKKINPWIKNTEIGFITLKNIEYKYKNKHDKGFILKLKSLEINSKGLLVIAGPSGSGKSTLLNLISNLYSPDKGAIFFNDSLINPKKEISYVSQNIKLLDTSILENVAFGIEKEKIDKNKATKALSQAGILNKVNIQADKIYENVGSDGNKFSGGERQRITLARALYKEPKLLILDEPTSQLDAKIADEFILVLEKLSKKISIVMVTHNVTVKLQEISNVFYINE